MDERNTAASATLTAAERTELLDWVSACQSAYHIESTPGHRFGGLSGKLEENRQSLCDYVEDLLAARTRVAPLTDDQVERMARSVPPICETGQPSWEHAVIRAYEAARGFVGEAQPAKCAGAGAFAGWKPMPPRLTGEMRVAMVGAALRYMRAHGGNSPEAMYEAAFAAAPSPE